LTPTDQNLWSGRLDREEGSAPLRWHEIVRSAVDGTGNGTAFLGFACDAGVVRNRGRAGAAEGPRVLRQALSNLPVITEHALYDAGDVICVADELESAQREYSATVSRLLTTGYRVVGLGGGHEIAFAAFEGLATSLAARTPVPRIGIVNFDAHLDLRAGDRATSGTPFRQIAELCASRGWPFEYFCIGASRYANTGALFARADALAARYRLDEQLTVLDLPTARAELAAFVSGVDCTYLTLCLDVLPAAVAPGVSAPAARGVSLEVIEPLANDVARSGRLRLFDVAELCPRHDIDNRTARTAARIVASVVEGWAATETAQRATHAS
jgi:formiminoglutamase